MLMEQLLAGFSRWDPVFCYGIAAVTGVASRPITVNLPGLWIPLMTWRSTVSFMRGNGVAVNLIGLLGFQEASPVMLMILPGVMDGFVARRWGKGLRSQSFVFSLPGSIIF
ncbi:hypothetical protein Nepgr_013545 [Nepenthes gracilis]|uniref:Uncharacterized protein n=1 Tax=Nepenthes gracilis TaxID=150966 RepID=A0AAD3SJC5_NEPGR|nr:hypothetical protein Nepgr_013545 [Nepenthes gracilis]